MTAVVWWLVYLGAYLGLVSGITWPEVVAGAAVSAVAVAVSIVALRGTGIDFVGAPPHLWRLPAVARIVAGELATFLRATGGLLRGRQPHDRWVAVPLDQPVGAGADAGLTIEAAPAPNTVVVAVLEGQDALLLHQLEASDRGRSSFPRWAR